MLQARDLTPPTRRVAAPAPCGPAAARGPGQIDQLEGSTMKKQSIALVIALAALSGVGAVVAPVTDAQAFITPCCKTGT
ncbi:hypothetical protein CTE05_19360 [Cellulomonas terrae]|uniref:Uncharacterized protein n=1 Tax=Cellulomonas terrae TaxID=311234 RepID=A0A511JKH7_9CELL|nr:hypothetical protein CTE05_19360 [Cellulomonas terrae]